MKRINIILDNITLDAIETIRRDFFGEYPGIKITTSDIVRVALTSTADAIKQKNKQ